MLVVTCASNLSCWYVVGPKLVYPLTVVNVIHRKNHICIVYRTALSLNWVNGFRLKPYKGKMPENSFQEDENPQAPENRSEGGTAPESTDPVEPGTAGK